MTDGRYNTPAKGAVDWHSPLNENFAQLDQDVEIRDVEANRSNYEPKSGAKFFATDSGATYTGDGTGWNLVGYVTRAGGGDLGHYVNYADGLQDEEINRFFFEPDENLEVTRLSFPMKGVSSETIDANATLSVYEGSTDGNLLVELDGNDFTTATSDSSGPWVATSSPVTVTVSNSTGAAIDAVPKVWVNIRR